MNTSLSPSRIAVSFSLLLCAFAPLVGGDEPSTPPTTPSPAAKAELLCPVSGRPVAAEHAADYRGGKVRFCSAGCAKKFQRQPESYAAGANRQLFASGQAEQVRCPLTGKELRNGLTVDAGGSDVGLCCPRCRNGLSKLDDQTRTKRLFGKEAFERGFRVLAQAAKNDARKQQPQAPLTPQQAEQLLANALAVQQKHTAALLQVRGVVGTAVSEGEQGPLVKVYAESEQTGKLPATLDGVPVQVDVVGRIFAGPPPAEFAEKEKLTPEAETFRHRTEINARGHFARPVPIGVSVGNVGECSSGTISCRVKNGLNQLFALSNNHVLALENDAPLNSYVQQPGLYDAHCTATVGDRIGQLAQFKLIFFGGTDNTIDAAISTTTAPNLGTATPSDGYGMPKTTVVSPMLKMLVQKYGRTTGLTHGKIDGINATFNVSYESGSATFVGQISIKSKKPKAFMKAGDSGSLLVTDPGRNPVGLCFAANNKGTLGVANPIQPVLDEFQVTIDGEP